MLPYKFSKLLTPFPFIQIVSGEHSLCRNAAIFTGICVEMRALVSIGYDNKENRIRNFLFLTVPAPGLISQEPTKQRMWREPNGSILMEVMEKYY